MFRTELKIVIQSELKRKTQDGEDITKELTKDLHKSIYNVLEEYITDGDEIEDSILDKLEESGYNLKNKGISDLGQVVITLNLEKEEEIKQDIEEGVIDSLNKARNHKSQKRLKEFA